MRDLVAKVDVMVENFAPGVIERLGFGYETVHELNPRLVMCSISLCGQAGPLLVSSRASTISARRSPACSI